jgi:bacterial DNA-binding protein
MFYKDFVKSVSSLSDVPQNKVDAVLKALPKVLIKEVLSKEDKVNIPYFGTFYTKRRKGYINDIKFNTIVSGFKFSKNIKDNVKSNASK